MYHHPALQNREPCGQGRSASRVSPWVADQGGPGGYRLSPSECLSHESTIEPGQGRRGTSEISGPRRRIAVSQIPSPPRTCCPCSQARQKMYQWCCSTTAGSDRLWNREYTVHPNPDCQIPRRYRVRRYRYQVSSPARFAAQGRVQC